MMRCVSALQARFHVRRLCAAAARPRPAAAQPRQLSGPARAAATAAPSMAAAVEDVPVQEFIDKLNTEYEKVRDFTRGGVDLC